MPTMFEVGKFYEANDPGLDPIKILKRTEKSILVWNGHTTWRMMIRHDGNGNEFVEDSSVGIRFRDDYTYSSRWCAE